MRANEEDLGITVISGSAIFHRDADWFVRSWRTQEEWCSGEPGLPPIQVGAARLLDPSGDPDRFTHHGIQRIVYGLSWADRGASSGMARIDSASLAPQFEIIAASTLLAGPTSRDAFKGRLVVLGGSFAEARDIHPTPIGPMPGSAVIANAIASLVERGEFAPVPHWFGISVVVLIIAGASLLFARLHHFWATLVSSALIFLCLIPTSFLLLRHGRWLDLALPLFGIVLHNVAAQAEGALKGGSETTHG
jgi:CHASE2 domain-containing sensor protein